MHLVKDFKHRSYAVSHAFRGRAPFATLAKGLIQLRNLVQGNIDSTDCHFDFA
jgi:hypothetical protein